jgi:hypothetical protein
MNYICTWLCTEVKREEDIYNYTGERHGQKNQNVYWRCLLLFYAPSKRFNINKLPILDGRDVKLMLDDLGVEVIFIESIYITPKVNFNFRQDHFYKFSVLEYIARNDKNLDDHYMILDSDCIFTRSTDSLFEEAKPKGFIFFEHPYATDLIDYGFSRVNMKSIYEDLSRQAVNKMPAYHFGEFFLGSVKNIHIIFNGFLELWPELIRRGKVGLPKLDEESQSLGYLYYKNKFVSSKRTDLFKRIWTNPVFYRNVERSDVDVAIWHLPAEKTYGLARLYEVLIKNAPNYSLSLPNDEYQNILHNTLGIPHLAMQIRLKYYFLNYLKAIRQRIKI